MTSKLVEYSLTLEEYIEFEEQSEIRHEFIDGKIYPLVGHTSRHSRISANCSAELGNKLRDTSCRAYGNGMRVKITDTKYVYPDCTFVCGQAKFADGNHTMLTNPTFVAEVISPSSAAYDRGEKSEFYRSLPSVQAYLLLDQERVFAQLYTRQESGWLLREFGGLDAIVPLEALDCSLPLSEAYRDIEFED